MRFNHSLATFIPKLSEERDEQDRRFARVARLLHEAESFFNYIARHGKQLSLLDQVTRTFFLAGTRTPVVPGTEDMVQRILGMFEVRQGKSLASRDESWQAWARDIFAGRGRGAHRFARARGAREVIDSADRPQPFELAAAT